MNREIIIAALSGCATPDELNRLEAWRRADPKNEEHFQRYAHLWSLVGTVGRDFAETDNAEPRNPQEAEPAQIRKTDLHPLGTGVRVRRAARYPALAAVVLGAIFGIRALAEKLEESSPRVQETFTGANQLATIPLPDGSVIRLGPQSRMAVDVDDDGVSAYVEGLAFFTVRAGNPRGFRVRTEAGQVHVLGTRFSVLARDAQLEVMVVQGSVELSSSSGQIRLARNELGRVRGDGPPSSSPVEDVYQELAWTGDFVAFESTPLREVAREFESRFDIELILADSVVAERTVTGWFRDRSPIDVLSDLCLAVNASCRQDGDRMWMEVNSNTGAERTVFSRASDLPI